MDNMAISANSKHCFQVTVGALRMRAESFVHAVKSNIPWMSQVDPERTFRFAETGRLGWLKDADALCAQRGASDAQTLPCGRG
jgi:hypothetical protein